MIVLNVQPNTISGFNRCGTFSYRQKREWRKTGRHFPQVEELLKAMNDERRSCSTCKHNRSGHVQCIECNQFKGFSRWEPKEGAE